MERETAFEVEAAFIDYFGLSELTNKVKGHHSNRGMKSAEEINCPKFILIKIKDYWIGQREKDIYQTVRGNWKLSIKRANQYPYVLAVRYGIVVGVFKVNENGWKKAPNSKRICFEGVEAEERIKQIFYKKKIPERCRKRQNPASYCD